MTTRTLKIQNSVIDRLSDLRNLVLSHRLIAGGVLVVITVGILVWAFIDTSDELNAAQIQDAKAFVQRTHSAAVIDKFNDVIGDGQLTVNEIRAVIEVAKRVEPGYGFLSDKNNNE